MRSTVYRLIPYTFIIQTSPGFVNKNHKIVRERIHPFLFLFFRLFVCMVIFLISPQIDQIYGEKMKPSFSKRLMFWERIAWERNVGNNLCVVPPASEPHGSEYPNPSFSVERDPHHTVFIICKNKWKWFSTSSVTALAVPPSPQGEGKLLPRS